MVWEEDYDDGYILDEEDEMVLIEAGLDIEPLSGGLREELDYEQYELEKEEADSVYFPESFEEWRLGKEQKRWEDERAELAPDLLFFEE